MYLHLHKYINLATFPFAAAVTLLNLGGSVGGTPDLVQDCVVEAGVTLLP